MGKIRFRPIWNKENKRFRIIAFGLLSLAEEDSKSASRGSRLRQLFRWSPRKADEGAIFAGDVASVRDTSHPPRSSSDLAERTHLHSVHRPRHATLFMNAVILALRSINPDNEKEPFVRPHKRGGMRLRRQLLIPTNPSYRTQWVSPVIAPHSRDWHSLPNILTVPW